MKVIVVGVDKTGQSLIKNLSNEKHDIVGVDTDAAQVQSVIEQYDVNGVVGNGCFSPILAEAGAADADLLIAVTDRDETNILCCLVGKSLGAHNLIAQVRNPDYYANFESMVGRLGIDRFVNLKAILAEHIARIIKTSADVNLNSFAGGRLEIAEIKIAADSKFCGKALSELRGNRKKDFLVVAIERGSEVIVPNGSAVLQAGDVLSVCARHQEQRDVFGYFGVAKHKIQSVLIVGSGDEAYYLASALLSEGLDVKIIGREWKQCEAIKSALPEANVICDDYTDKKVLDREGFGSMDAIVAMAPSEETNIVTSLYAKTKNVSKAVTVLWSDSYRGLLEEISLNLAVSPYDLAGAEIATYVRSIDVPKDSQIISMQKIAGGKAEALYFNIGKNTLFVGRSVKELGPLMKRGVLIGALVRKRSAIIPHGETVLEEGDGIVVASLQNIITKLEDILEGV